MMFQIFLFLSTLTFAQTPTKMILSDPSLLRAANIAPLRVDTNTGTAVARVTSEQELTLSARAHEWRRCGGYEVLPETRSVQAFSSLQTRMQKDAEGTNEFNGTLERHAEIELAIAQVNPENLKSWVTWFSSYPTRFNNAPTANDHVMVLKTKLEEMVKHSSYPVTVSLIDHNRTPQKSVRVHIEGAKSPSEFIVLGAHMDSINQEFFGGKNAPGADDNASGSSNIIEALRLLLTQHQPDRSIDFMFYAGEESGLLGSAEIAQDWKNKKMDVVAVLQLDMTLYPGSGVFTLGSMTDFTSPWLRGYLKELNNLYIQAKIVDDKCGYGCSDHASWYRQGYPTLMPFEATFNGMNNNLHTRKDVIDADSNFVHSAMFTKIALAMAMDLGNSTLREN